MANLVYYIDLISYLPRQIQLRNRLVHNSLQLQIEDYLYYLGGCVINERINFRK